MIIENKWKIKLKICMYVYKYFIRFFFLKVNFMKYYVNFNLNLKNKVMLGVC